MKIKSNNSITLSLPKTSAMYLAVSKQMAEKDDTPTSSDEETHVL